jgi:WD40 repeat protein
MDVSGAQLAVGCSNNSLALVDMARGQARTVMEGHSGEIWALAVHPELPIFATGALDKQLRVWDARAHSAKAEKTVALKSGVICAAFSPNGQTLAVGLENGTLQLYDFASMKLSFEKKMHKERVAAVLFSPNGQVVATGSWDQSISLLDTETKSSVTLNGHTSSVTHLTFSRDSKYLQSNSRDYEILFWDTEAGKRVERNSVADVEWHDWQCILGYPVRSVFRSGMDGTDVNTCHVSHGKELVAAGDDMATVSLFRYPAAHANQASLEFAGHSSHVTNVRFSADDRYLFSTGGLDFGVFQWAVVPHN